jgi:hypothetical protein
MIRSVHLPQTMSEVAQTGHVSFVAITVDASARLYELKCGRPLRHPSPHPRSSPPIEPPMPPAPLPPPLPAVIAATWPSDGCTSTQPWPEKAS